MQSEQKHVARLRIFTAGLDTETDLSFRGRGERSKPNEYTQEITTVLVTSTCAGEVFLVLSKISPTGFVLVHDQTSKVLRLDQWCTRIYYARGDPQQPCMICPDMTALHPDTTE